MPWLRRLLATMSTLSSLPYHKATPRLSLFESCKRGCKCLLSCSCLPLLVIRKYKLHAAVTAQLKGSRVYKSVPAAQVLTTVAAASALQQWSILKSCRRFVTQAKLWREVVRWGCTVFWSWCWLWHPLELQQRSWRRSSTTSPAPKSTPSLRPKFRRLSKPRSEWLLPLSASISTTASLM